MLQKGYHQLTIMVTTDPEGVPEGDALWNSHHAYVRDRHQDILITYSLTKGTDLSNPLDPGSAPTGKTSYVLNECFRTSADIHNHWAWVSAEWPDFNGATDVSVGACS